MTASEIAIGLLADAEADLLERVADLSLERDAYRELAQQAIHALADLTRQENRLRDSHHRTLDEYRRLRAEIMRQAEAA